MLLIPPAKANSGVLSPLGERDRVRGDFGFNQPDSILFI
jgi:hypothetical protein